MVTNKGIFLAALVLGLCIIVASIINSAAVVKSSHMGKRGAAWGCQMGGERGDRDNQGGREQMRGDRNDRDERGDRDGRGDRDERGDRREGMRGGREGMQGCPMMGGERGGMRGMRAGMQRGGQRQQRGGGGSEVAQCPVQQESCTGSGYLFN